MLPVRFDPPAAKYIKKLQLSKYRGSNGERLTYKSNLHMIKMASKNWLQFLHGATLRRRPSFYSENKFYSLLLKLYE